tara:strand:+ start:342 stop:596 length:255 start_codon:yes stop_codon:yes gene_type:complete
MEAQALMNHIIHNTATKVNNKPMCISGYAGDNIISNIQGAMVLICKDKVYVSKATKDKARVNYTFDYTEVKSIIKTVLYVKNNK